MWIRGSGSTITERWNRGSGSTFPKCGSQDPDPDPRQNEMDPKRCYSALVDILHFVLDVRTGNESNLQTETLETTNY